MIRGFDPDDPFDGAGDGDGGDPFDDGAAVRRGRHRRRGLRPVLPDEVDGDLPDPVVEVDAESAAADGAATFGARARELDAAGWDDAADAADDAALVIGDHAGWRRFVTTGPLPVDGGIVARTRRGRFGATWWSQRFLSVIESLDLGGRLDRGRSYARRGQVIRLDVHSGSVQAEVQGSAARPYRVEIELRRLAERDWARVIEALARRASFCATLLAGEMPDDVEDAFVGARVGLFPVSRDELATRCTCPDPVRPCKHVAAVLYLLAERFDDDPFALFAWRGRDRGALLAELREHRRRLVGSDVDTVAAGVPDQTGLLRDRIIGAGAAAYLAEQLRPDSPATVRPDPAHFWERSDPVAWRARELPELASSERDQPRGRWPGRRPGQDSAGFSRWPPKA